MTIQSCAPSDLTIVEIENGTLKGDYENEVFVWKGIPYAQPPVGDLRWKAPLELDTWGGVKSATTYGNICPQTGYGEDSIYEIPPEPMSEDCLYLNVWTKNLNSEEKLPVFVWIHGGSLTREGGTHPQYLGYNMAKKGLVYVSINYRLNAFGFLAHPGLSVENDKGISGNYGILDQVAALQWVQDNIEAFGGDPNNATIAGESAGGWSVSMLMATPLSKGLFHKAIMQSGAYMWSGPHLKEAANGYKSGEEAGVEFGEAIGASTIEEMRALSSDQIVEHFFSRENKLPSEPLVDGQVFTEDINAVFENAKHHKVDVLLGANSGEWLLWVPKSLPTDPLIYRQYIIDKYPN